MALVSIILGSFVGSILAVSGWAVWDMTLTGAFGIYVAISFAFTLSTMVWMIGRERHANEQRLGAPQRV